VLERLEADPASSASLDDLPLFAAHAPPPAKAEPGPVERQLAALDLDGMSPREAMEALYRLKGLLN
jgi:DNA mismatch repair protein MutS